MSLCSISNDALIVFASLSPITELPVCMCNAVEYNLYSKFVFDEYMRMKYEYLTVVDTDCSDLYLLQLKRSEEMNNVYTFSY